MKKTKDENEKKAQLFDFYENIKQGNTEPPEIPQKEETNVNKTLPLPSHEWFVTMHDGKPASNTFTGSYRKDTTKGHFSTTTFNYNDYVNVEIGQSLGIKVEDASL